MTGKGNGLVNHRRLRVGEGADGYAMVALLVGLGVMAVMMSAAMPTWRTAAQREREAELVFRGQQYARAIALFQRKFANAFPPNIDLLIDQKFLRKKYKDPITDSDFQLLYVGQTQGQGNDATGQQGRTGGAAGPGGGLATARTGGPGAATTAQPAGLSATPLGGRAGIMGVSSKSEAKSLREYNGRTKYNEWAFVAVQATTRAGAPTGGQTPNDGANGGVGGPGARGGGLQPGGGGRGGTQQPGGGRGRGGPTQPFGGGSRGSGL